MRRGRACFVFCAAAFVAQWVCSVYLSFHGLSPQFLVVATIEAAALWGPDAAMLSGFGLGLSWDALSPNLFGGRALALALIGCVVGRLRKQVDVMSLGSQIFFAAAATVFYRTALGFLGLIFLGRFLWIGWALFLAEPLYNALSAVAFYFLDRSLFEGSSRGMAG